MKSALTKSQPEIGAAEFKARCLELIDDIHAHKRSSVIITKRGKPYAKLVPVASKEEPLHGFMKGLVTIRGDVTKPIEVDWKALK
jgi:prevent-host-death family protein